MYFIFTSDRRQCGVCWAFWFPQITKEVSSIGLSWYVTLDKDEEILSKGILINYSDKNQQQQLASKLSYLGEPRENARARGRGRESLQQSLINFHFHPGNPGTLQSVKTVTANVPQIRKVQRPVKFRQPRACRIIYL